MSLQIGIVGLPNVGKSTLFNALLKKQVAQSANFPFTTIEPNVGVVEVPDGRLEKLKEVVEKNEGLAPGFKIVPATVNFVDIAGLVKGANKGEGLGNKFLSHIREVDAICFVVRDFKNADILETGSGNWQEDLEVLKSELLLKDLETLEKLAANLERDAKTKPANDPLKIKLAVLLEAKGLVEGGKWVADELSEEDLLKIKDAMLLSAKKSIVVINSSEEDVKKEAGKGVIRICAKTEEELASLSDEEQKEYLNEMGLGEPGLNRLIKLAYETLGLATFLTAGPKEVRAWTIKHGSTAPQAAGVIHTDFERGFIAADIVVYDKFVEEGGWKGAREKGSVKTIGKNEVMPDDVVVEFKFSV